MKKANKQAKNIANKKAHPVGSKIFRKKDDGKKAVLFLPESRLTRILDKIPSWPTGENNIDIEELLVAKWRENMGKSKISLLIDAGKNSPRSLEEWKKRLFANIREAGHISFSYPNALYSFGDKTESAKKETLDKIRVKPWLVKFASVGLMVFIVSAAIVRLMPIPVEKYLKLTDRIILAPFYPISRNNLSFLAEKIFNRKEPVAELASAVPPIIDHLILADFIVKNADELISRSAAGQNTYLIRLEDLKGLPAGAEEMNGSRTESLEKPGLIDIIRQDAKIFFALVDRWLDKTVK